MGLEFSIRDWRAWAPGISDREDWISWAATAAKNANATVPNVSFIAPMQRRRLSPLARCVASVAVPLLNSHGAMPIVCGSRHGEVGRTLNILWDLAEETPASPASFSLSVHNAIVGLLSIQNSVTSSITSLAAGGNEVVSVLLESLGLLEREPKVLCVVYDEPVPSEYRVSILPVEPYAMAFVVERGQEFVLQQSSLPPADCDIPQALRLIRLLLSSYPSDSVAEPQNLVELGLWTIKSRL